MPIESVFQWLDALFLLELKDRPGGEDPMKFHMTHIVLYVAYLFGAASTPATEPASNEFCPVTLEEKVDPTIFVEYESRRVEFCCQRCMKKFLEEPGKYIENLPQLGIAAGVHGESSNDHTATTSKESTGLDHTGAGKEFQLTHDHERDHGESHGVGRAIRFAGKFHPLIVHFPIAFILGAALAEVIFLVTGRGHFSIAAHFSIRAGALTALLAVTLGWAAASFASYPGALADTLVAHRWLGLSTGVAAVIAGGASLLSQRADSSPRGIWAYRTALFLSAALVGITGHFGGVLIYGYEHFQW
jgi:uncharacterized membrane protein